MTLKWKDFVYPCLCLFNISRGGGSFQIACFQDSPRRQRANTPQFHQIEQCSTSPLSAVQPNTPKQCTATQGDWKWLSIFFKSVEICMWNLFLLFLLFMDQKQVCAPSRRHTFGMHTVYWDKTRPPIDLEVYVWYKLILLFIFMHLPDAFIKIILVHSLGTHDIGVVATVIYLLIYRKVYKYF